MNIFPLNDLPLYDADIDVENLPASVRSLKSAISDHDGLVICSPEYNYGMSGVLKNAIDWASRPAFKSPLKDKPVLIMTSSPGFTGGVRAQCQLRETFNATLSRVISRPEVVIAGINDKIRDGKLQDRAALDFALAAIDDLISEVLLVRAR